MKVYVAVAASVLALSAANAIPNAEDVELSLSAELEVAKRPSPRNRALVASSSTSFVGSLKKIPSSGKWTTSSQQLKKVTQFAYEKFMASVSGSPQKKLRTQSERYREAVRATHLIANEMAGIDDEEEFGEMLNFVLSQWRNIRQRKMATTPLDSTGETSGVTTEDYSREREDYDALVKQEFNISTSEEENSSSDEERDAENSADSKKSASTVRIRLNPNAEKVGRPAKLKNKTAAGEKKDRKWYESNEAARQQAGEVTLLGLVDALDRAQPGLHETQRRLSGIIVKHGESEKKKPKVKLMKNPVLAIDPFYLLPPKLLDACIKVLPVSNTEDSAIAIEDSQASQRSIDTSDKASIETVIIQDVGNFSRKQIETFKRVQNLKDLITIRLGVVKWLVDVALPTPPAEYHALAQQVADAVMEAYPYKCIQGLPDAPEFSYGTLYRASPPSWLTDATNRGLCICLVHDYPTCRFAGFQAAVTKSKRTRKPEERCIDAAIRDLVLQQVKEDGVDTVMLPLNFANYHWCCVVVKVESKRIFYYDPLNQAQYKNAANDVAALKISGLHDYDVTPMNNPIQFDGHSCGVYVCWMFIGQVINGHHLKVSIESLTKRRFELFYYLLTGQPPLGDEEEEKVPAPRVEDKNSDNEETLPTQVQQ